MVELGVGDVSSSLAYSVQPLAPHVTLVVNSKGGVISCINDDHFTGPRAENNVLRDSSVDFTMLNDEGDGNQGPPDSWCYESKHTANQQHTLVSDGEGRSQWVNR